VLVALVVVILVVFGFGVNFVINYSKKQAID
jgi:preprotein translocase subunit SecE